MKRRIKAPALMGSILTSVVLGVLAGLFFGEYCRYFEVVGRAFIAIMQISVLPYILISLIQSIGSLEPGHAGAFARRGIVMILVLWGAVFALLSLLPLCFPNWPSASFFSPALLEPPSAIDYIYLFIPSNPFDSLANNIVPAVTVFSILCGIVLISMPNKRHLLNLLETASEMLTRLNLMLVRLSPLGIFALVANASGTMYWEEIGHLEIYLTAYLVLGALLFFLVLPLLLTAFTPFRYREIMRGCRTAMLTVLFTGNLFIVLPLLVENIRNLFLSHRLKDDESDQVIRILVPVVFILPCAGQLMDLLFILFAGWFNNAEFGLLGYLKLYAVGLLTTFGRATVAVPLLLSVFKLPLDMIGLFTISSVITDNIRFTVEALTVFCFTAFFAAWQAGAVRSKLRRVAGNMLLVTGVCLVSLLALGGIFRLLPVPEDKRHVFDAMSMRPLLDYEVFDRLPDTGPPEPEGSRLDQIHRTGTLRVGFNANVMPFSYFNDQGDLIGFDIVMAHLLAAELGCRKVEFYPIVYGDLIRPLQENLVDIVMGEVSIDEVRLGKVAFTDHYLELSTALLVPDHLKWKLTENPGLLQKRGFRIAALEGSDYILLEEMFPAVKKIKIASYDEFFDRKIRADALLTTAEAGAFRTILYPEYDIYIPARQNKDLIAYAIATDDMRFLEYLNFWLTLKRLNGDIDREYDYWIRGIDVKARPPRWSILHNLILRNSNEPGPEVID